MLKATRDGFGAAMRQAAEKDKNLMVLCADVSESLRLNEFKKQFPEQYLELGVSEQNMIGVAAGLASRGHTVVVSSFATFNPGRNWEQIRVSLCEQKLNVKIVGGHAGLATGPDGATHQALEDIALMSVLPEMKVVAPADYREAKEAALAMLSIDGPVYLRLSREPAAEIEQDGGFQFGQARKLAEGTDATIMTYGLTLPLALQAAKELEDFQFQVRVLNFSTIKPLDEHSLKLAVQETKAIVVVEEAEKIGGLSSMVATYLGENCLAPLEIVAVDNSFGQSGKKGELFDYYGLTVEKIKTQVLRAIERKLAL